MKKRYTKKQITEAIAYWQKQLKTVTESSGYSSRLLTEVPVTAILDSLDVFDECASWSKMSGADSYKTKFSGESAQKVASAFSGASDFSLKFLGISSVMSREEYAEYAEEQESDRSYDDYIDDEVCLLKDALSRKQLVGSLFKPREVLVIDNVVFNDKPGKTVLVVPYAMQ